SASAALLQRARAGRVAWARGVVNGDVDRALLDFQTAKQLASGLQRVVVAFVREHRHGAGEAQNSGRRFKARLQYRRAAKIAPLASVRAARMNGEAAAALLVEQRREYGRRREVRQAQPID